MKAKKRYSRNIILLAIIILILCLLFRKIVFRNNTPVFYLTVLNLNELKTVSPNTVIHKHANIHRALKYSVKMDMIYFNPDDKVDRPKKQRFIAEHYSLEELAALFEATKTHYLGLLIQVTAFYGLRRIKVLGLKWDAIDFENKTITIKHILTCVQIDGKREIVKEDRAKSKIKPSLLTACSEV